MRMQLVASSWFNLMRSTIGEVADLRTLRQLQLTAGVCG